MSTPSHGLYEAQTPMHAQATPMHTPHYASTPLHTPGHEGIPTPRAESGVWQAGVGDTPHHQPSYSDPFGDDGGKTPLDGGASPAVGCVLVVVVHWGIIALNTQLLNCTR